MKDQVIRCQIESCIHNSPDHFCQLRTIKVTPCAPKSFDNVANKSDSMCSNFQKKEATLF